MPQVSIVTPCYNSEKFIRDTINSVLSQTYKDWEWIITDDCSKDDSTKIIENIKDERIKLIKLDQNKGAANAYNTSLKNATGRYITFIDSDDIWDENFLEEMTYFLIKNDEELVHCGYRRKDENLEPLLPDFSPNKKVTFNSLLYSCTLSTLATMYDSKRIGKNIFLTTTKEKIILCC